MSEVQPDRPGLFGRAIRFVLGPVFRRMPLGWRRTLRAARLRYLVRRKMFGSDEPEYRKLAEWLRPGDVAMDVGANFGSFSLRMSELVGEDGRVYAFEPVPQTFALLATALSARGCKNVSALNLACSDTTGIVTMSVPDDPVSGENLYQASISVSGPSLTKVVCARIDDLPLPTKGLRLVKIDAEGHDAEVISGMWQLIRKEMPILIAEHPSATIIDRLKGLGYLHSHELGSPNAVFTPPRESR